MKFLVLSAAILVTSAFVRCDAGPQSSKEADLQKLRNINAGLEKVKANLENGNNAGAGSRSMDGGSPPSNLPVGDSLKTVVTLLQSLLGVVTGMVQKTGVTDTLGLPNLNQTVQAQLSNISPGQNPQAQDPQAQDPQAQNPQSQYLPQNMQPQDPQAQNVQSQNIQPQNMPPQNMPSQNMPPQNMPPQNMPPQNPQQQNMQPQNLQQQNMQPQNMQPQNMQQQNRQPDNNQAQNPQGQYTDGQNPQTFVVYYK